MRSGIAMSNGQALWFQLSQANAHIFQRFLARWDRDSHSRDLHLSDLPRVSGHSGGADLGGSGDNFSGADLGIDDF